VKYYDSDEDKIVVESQIEWEEMLNELNGSKVIKVLVEEVEVKEQVKEEEKKVPKCPMEGMKCPMQGMKCPMQEMKCPMQETKCPMEGNNWGNLGPFVEQFVNAIKGVPMNKENVENWMKFPMKKSKKMFWKLHRMSLECLDSLDKNVIMKGKEYLLQMLEIVPGHTVALYNLACAESLLGNVKEALATLENAINAGYNNLEHMLSDKDFNNIKDTDGFRQLVAKLENMLYGEDIKVEKKEEEKKVEEKKVEEKKVEEKKDPLEAKIDTLIDIFGLPRDVVRDLLTQCKNNVDEVVELIYGTFN